MNAKKTIGITGASGLLGTFAALRFIELGYNVKCHRNKSDIPTELIKHNVQWIVGDIRDQFTIKQLFEDCDIILHSAAMVSFDSSMERLMTSVNVEGTKLVVDNIIGTNIKLIHISSIAALGRVDLGKEVDESVAFNQEVKNSAYAKSKYLSELEVHRGIAEGIEAMILMPSIILGKNESNTSSSTLWDQILKFPKFAPAGANGFVDVEDVVTAIVQCLKYWQSDERFVINGHNLTYLALYEMVSAHIGKQVKPVKVSILILLLLLPFVKLYFILTGANSKVSKSAIITTSKTYSYSNVKSVINLKIEYTPIQNTIDRFC